MDGKTEELLTCSECYRYLPSGLLRRPLLCAYAVITCLDEDIPKKRRRIRCSHL
jgi:hypothetical protein